MVMPTTIASMAPMAKAATKAAKYAITQSSNPNSFKGTDPMRMAASLEPPDQIVMIVVAISRCLTLSIGLKPRGGGWGLLSDATATPPR